MTEEEARRAIIQWAMSHFAEEDEPPPDVSVLRIRYDERTDEWIAALDVSSSADHPLVTFFKDEEYGLQVASVEY